MSGRIRKKNEWKNGKIESEEEWEDRISGIMGKIESVEE